MLYIFNEPHISSNVFLMLVIFALFAYIFVVVVLNDSQVIDDATPWFESMFVLVSVAPDISFVFKILLFKCSE